MIDVHIPKAGMSTVEVDVIAVHVASGDTVEPETVLIEVESEKATFEVEAGHAGTVRELLVEEGDEAKVGDVIARIERLGWRSSSDDQPAAPDVRLLEADPPAADAQLVERLTGLDQRRVRRGRAWVLARRRDPDDGARPRRS